MSGEDKVDVKAAQPLDGAEVALQGPRGRVGPEADVRRDLEQQVVPGEEESSLLIVQDEMKVRMPRGVNHPRLAPPKLYPVLRTEGGQTFRQTYAEPRGSGRGARHFGVHAVTHHVPHEAV